MGQKAGHLVGLLPAEAPLFVGFQEIGDLGDLNRLNHAASQRFKRKYQPFFVQGKDSATDQDVGAILDTTRGWGGYGRPSRVSDLERELSKHLVVRLTNAFTHIDVAVVHLVRAGRLIRESESWAVLHTPKVQIHSAGGGSEEDETTGKSFSWSLFQDLR